MLDAAVEQHEIQLGVVLVDGILVVLLLVHQDAVLHLVLVVNGLVDLRDDIVDVDVVWDFIRWIAHEVSEVDVLVFTALLDVVLYFACESVAELFSGQSDDLVVEPGDIFGVRELIRKHTVALIGPLVHQHGRVVDLLRGILDEALHDSTQITQVEDVVELGWRWQHLDLRVRPETTRERYKAPGDLNDLVIKAASRGKVAVNDRREDSVELVSSWQVDVDDGELGLQPCRDVITTTTWERHGSNEGKVLELVELTGLVQRVETTLLDDLTCELIRRLISPLVDKRDVDFIDEDDTLSSVRRTIDETLTLFNKRLDVLLQDTHGCGRREVYVVDRVVVVVWGILASKVCEDVLGLTGTGFTSQQRVERCLVKLGDQVFQACVVDSWDQDACERRIAVRRIRVHRHDVHPLLPLALVVDEVVVDEVVLVFQLRHVELSRLGRVVLLQELLQVVPIVQVQDSAE